MTNTLTNIFDDTFNKNYYQFNITDNPKYKFSIIKMSGTEGLLKPWKIELSVAGTQIFDNLNNLTVSNIINKPCTLTINNEVPDKTSKYSGIITAFNIITEMDTGIYLYKIKMESHLTLLSQNQHSKIYMAVNVIDVIKDILKRYSQINSTLSLQHQTDETYAVKKYIIQKDETDFNFMNRLMEHWGIYYYIIENDNKPQLIITDSMSDSTSIQLNFGKYGDQKSDTLFNISQRITRIPSKVTIKDYNYRSEKVSIEASAVASSLGSTEEVLYNENVTTIEEAKYIAQIRADQYRCSHVTLFGETNSNNVVAGQYIKVLENSLYTEDYFVTETKFMGSQVSSLYQQFQTYFKDAEDSKNFKDSALFMCEFKAIDKSTVFRPALLTDVPKQETVSSAIISNQEQINNTVSKDTDDYITGTGEFLVKDNRFDYTAGENSKEFSSIRTVTPDVGVGHEISFPHKNTDEVMVSYERGNFSRPVIAGSVFNAIAKPLITSSNSNINKMKLPGKNELVIYDSKWDSSKEDDSIKNDNGILLKSNNNDSYIAIGNLSETRDEKNKEQTVLKDFINGISEGAIKDIEYGIIIKSDEALINKTKESHDNVFNHSFKGGASASGKVCHSFKNITGLSLEIILGYHGRAILGLYSDLVYGAQTKGNLLLNKLNLKLEHFSEAMIEKGVSHIPVTGEDTIVNALEGQVGGDINEAIADKINAALERAELALQNSTTHLEECRAQDRAVYLASIRSGAVLTQAIISDREINLSVIEKKEAIVEQQIEAERAVQSVVTSTTRGLSQEIQAVTDDVNELISQGE